MTAPARRVLVRSMVERGLSERHALTVIGMSASSLRYVPAPDRNATLPSQIVTLVHRHRRYGAGMIYLKLAKVVVRRRDLGRTAIGTMSGFRRHR